MPAFVSASLQFVCLCSVKFQTFFFCLSIAGTEKNYMGMIDIRIQTCHYARSRMLLTCNIKHIYGTRNVSSFIFSFIKINMDTHEKTWSRKIVCIWVTPNPGLWLFKNVLVLMIVKMYISNIWICFYSLVNEKVDMFLNKHQILSNANQILYNFL